jgi:thioredoxin-like negative regulator of GroEL
MTELTHSSFHDFVRINRFAVIHFWARWNLYDEKMKDLLQSQIPAELTNLIALGRFDTDVAEHTDICRHHQILNLPFLALFRDGAVVQTVTGMLKTDQIVVRSQALVSEGIYPASPAYIQFCPSQVKPSAVR